MPSTKFPTPPLTSPFLGVREIAALIPDGSTSTVYHWMSTGQLASRKVGRRRLASRADVARFLGLPVDQLGT